MTLQELIIQAEDRDLSKSYPKADGLYIWDYKLIDATNLELIVSNSSKAGFKDKVSIDELATYLRGEWAAGTVPYHSFDQIQITGAEGITVAKV
tara:strand:- start:2297 stop:2578 length:282 start_codon:yes stop_codon:yes gene_type:complete